VASWCAPRGDGAKNFERHLSVGSGRFTLHAATRAGGQDERGREALLKYVIRPPIAQERITQGPDALVRIALKKPFSDETTSVDLGPRSALSFVTARSSSATAALSARAVPRRACASLSMATRDRPASARCQGCCERDVYSVLSATPSRRVDEGNAIIGCAASEAAARRGRRRSVDVREVPRRCAGARLGHHAPSTDAAPPRRPRDRQISRAKRTGGSSPVPSPRWRSLRGLAAPTMAAAASTHLRRGRSRVPEVQRPPSSHRSRIGSHRRASGTRTPRRRRHGPAFGARP